MRYTLRDDIYHCLAGQKVIFLDLRQGRYFALPPACESAFLRLKEQRGESVSGAVETLEPLIRAGHLVECPEPNIPFREYPLCSPVSDLSGCGSASFHLLAFLRAFYWEIVSAARLRLSPLPSVLNRAVRRERAFRPRHPDNAGSYLSLLSGFEFTDLVFGRANRCLSRSLAVFSMLRARGVTAQLVLGVRSTPFTAHAWVQHRGRVLNDTVEQVGHYTPIVVFG